MENHLLTENTDIDVILEIITLYFQNISPNTNFIIAEYQSSSEGKRQKIYKLQLENSHLETIPTVMQGATWDGEVLTLTRLL